METANNLNMTALYIGVIIYFACMIMVGFLVRKKASTAEGYLGTIRTFHMQRDKLDDAPLMAPPRAGSVGKRHWKPYGGHPYTPDEIAVPLISGAMELLGDPADKILALRDRLEDLYEKFRQQHQGQKPRHQYCRDQPHGNPAYAPPLPTVRYIQERLGGIRRITKSNRKSLQFPSHPFPLRFTDGPVYR